MSVNGKLTHAAREQLASEVQAEALRPTPQVNGHSLQDRLLTAGRRIRNLEEQVGRLIQQQRENRDQFHPEVLKQRRELGIRDSL